MANQKIMECVDQTITVICNHIQNQINKDNTHIPEGMPEEIKALAELLSARAQSYYEN